MSIQLTADGGADLTAQMIKEWQVEVIPLYIHFGEEEILSKDITTKSLLERIKQSTIFPSTSAAGPYEYFKVFEKVPKDRAIIHFSVSSGVSSAYKHAVMAKNMLLEKDPDRKIEIIDSKSASSGIILLIEDTFKKIKAGCPFDELIKLITDRVKHMRTIFILESLDNLIKSGRIDRVRATVAKTLNVKLLLHASTAGTIEVLDKVRGTKKATNRFIDKISEYVAKTKDQTLAIVDCQAKEKLSEFVSTIKDRYDFDSILQSEMGPLLALHASAGTIIMSFFGDDIRTD